MTRSILPVSDATASVAATTCVICIALSICIEAYQVLHGRYSFLIRLKKSKLRLSLWSERPVHPRPDVRFLQPCHHANRFERHHGKRHDRHILERLNELTWNIWLRRGSAGC